MKVVIFGYGHVGKAVKEFFPYALVYDPYLNIGDKDDLKDIDVAFICVPTPSLPDGGCDTSIVESIIKDINASLIIIRSTVKVGFTNEMITKYSKNIIFSPEFIGMSPNHIYKSEKDVNYIIIGKENYSDLSLIKYLYDEDKIHYVSTKEAEMVKYMLNAFLATKVMFANEIYDLCQKMDINYDHVKELFLLDPRIGKTHLNVDPNNPGYGGKCLPKDIKALEKMMEEEDSIHQLISSVIKENNN